MRSREVAWGRAGAHLAIVARTSSKPVWERLSASAVGEGEGGERRSVGPREGRASGSAAPAVGPRTVAVEHDKHVERVEQLHIEGLARDLPTARRATRLSAAPRHLAVGPHLASSPLTPTPPLMGAHKSRGGWRESEREAEGEAPRGPVGWGGVSATQRGRWRGVRAA
eukprot:4921568-Prymnesium_polylepis.2